MNPYLQVILWAVGIVVLFIVMMAWNNHKWKKTQKNRIKRTLPYVLYIITGISQKGKQTISKNKPAHLKVIIRKQYPNC